ncbi:light and oxygen sensing histidine kinase [Anopheles sinensis]|uniref:Light and oxygen sensing histidine kinase n=1 Tax=Anopheles sinensis TaxID=74873 RepID=A0A084WDF0_ANOSI|nr:light and oxygen sensing histidine kinase [Anopheles sinensis]
MRRRHLESHPTVRGVGNKKCTTLEGRLWHAFRNSIPGEDNDTSDRVDFLEAVSNGSSCELLMTFHPGGHLLSTGRARKLGVHQAASCRLRGNLCVVTEMRFHPFACKMAVERPT